MTCARGACWAVLLLIASCDAALAFRSYHVGNSLTWDSRPLFLPWLGAPGVPNTTSGWHINCGQPLSVIAADPSGVCFPPQEPFGVLSNALPNYAWDAVTLQPHTSLQGATGGQEVSAFSSILDLAGQPLPRDIHVLAAWPGAELVNDEITIDYGAVWNSSTTSIDGDSPMQYTRQWFDWYFEQVQAAEPEHRVLMIPTGQVLQELDVRFRAGDYPGISDASDLFRDVRHLNNVGRYAAYITLWSTIYQLNPMVLSWDAGFEGETGGVIPEPNIPRTPELSTLIRETVWEVVRNDPRTGITAGDYNNDGRVDAADFTLWKDAEDSTASLANDPLGGLVGNLQYERWAESFGSTIPLGGSLQSVPEPASVAVLGCVGLAGIIWWRKWQGR